MNSTLSRLLLWLAVVAAIWGIHALFSLEPGQFEGSRRPLPPEAEQPWSNARTITPPSGETPNEPAFEMIVEEDGEIGDAIGTAFLVAPGTWITAGHVFESCAKAYVRIQGHWRPFVTMTMHPVADVAIGTTSAPETPPHIQLTDRSPVLDQDGFHFGYPQGRPASVYTRFIGMARIRHGKPGTPLEPGWVWAEQERTPESHGSLGGISGGPQVDRTGAVQGITILHSERSARLTTTPMFRVREILPDGVAAAANGGAAIDWQDYAKHGVHVRQAGTVSLVFCSVDGTTRPR